MSTCISRNGEYSEHVPGPDPFVCGRCYVEDWDAAMAEIDRLRALLPKPDDEQEAS